MSLIEEATLTAQGQISIPKKIREKLHLEKGDKIAFFEDDDGRIFIQELESTLPISRDQWNDFLAKSQKESVTRLKGKKAAMAHLDRLGSGK